MDNLKKWKADPSKGEVFTPIELVNLILDEIPHDVWINPKSTFLDPCMGTGTFLTEIVRRLVDIYGYSELDAKSRVYGYEIRVKYINKLKRRGYVNIQHKDFLCDEIKMKFDVVVGNPPYQKNDGGGTGSSAVPIYNKFVEKSLEISDRVLLITPSRWFKGGKGLDSFREMMLNRKDIKLIKHFQNEKTCFDVELPGGVSYFYIDKNYKGLTKFIDFDKKTEIHVELNKKDIFISDIISNEIIDKVLSKNLLNFSDVVLSRNPFGVSSNFNNWSDEGTPIITKNGKKLISPINYSDNFNVLNSHKVLISKADGAAFKCGRVISKYHLSEPGVLNTETYLVCYTSTNYDECVNAGEYLLTKFSRFMLWIRMSSQNNSKDKFKWVPLMDFTKKWSDSELYSFFELNLDEIEYIEKSVK